MRGRNIWLAAGVILLSLSSVFAQPIRVLTTGDMHGWLEPSRVDSQTLGGAAEMLAYWKKVEGYKPEKFLVLSTGDLATGPELSMAFKGDPVIEVMNLMGYDASTVGNHEFDFGADHLKEWHKAAKFSFLSANISRKDGRQPDAVLPYVMVEQDGVKVAIVGLTTTDLHSLTTGAEEYEVHPYVETLRKFVPDARKQGAQAVIVAAHVEQRTLITLADQVKDLDIPLMLGAHSHEFAQRKVGSTWIVNSGDWWKGYTRIDLDYNPTNGKTTVISSKQVWLQQQGAKADDAVTSEIKRWKSRIERSEGDQE